MVLPLLTAGLSLAKNVLPKALEGLGGGGGCMGKLFGAACDAGSNPAFNCMKGLLGMGSHHHEGGGGLLSKMSGILGSLGACLPNPMSSLGNMMGGMGGMPGMMGGMPGMMGGMGAMGGLGGLMQGMGMGMQGMGGMLQNMGLQGPGMQMQGMGMQMQGMGLQQQGMEMQGMGQMLGGMPCGGMSAKKMLKCLLKCGLKMCGGHMPGMQGSHGLFGGGQHQSSFGAMLADMRQNAQTANVFNTGRPF